MIALTGCAGPPGRIMTEALRKDLEHLAPQRFWPQMLLCRAATESIRFYR